MASPEKRKSKDRAAKKVKPTANAISKPEKDAVGQDALKERLAALKKAADKSKPAADKAASAAR